MENAAAKGTAIEARGLARRFGRRWVVEGLDLAVPRGSVYGFLGLNGAGKSTTIRMLMGLIRRHGGEATVLGLDPARRPAEVKARVGYVPDSPAFYEWMRVDEICAFVAHYRKKDWDPRRAAELLERFAVPPREVLRNLSKGQRAKVSLVLAMAFNPEVLILDEPLSGLDPVARRAVIEAVLAEYQEQGRTIFISSHLVNELSGLVDHLGILHEGRLLLQTTADAFAAGVRRLRMVFAGEAPRAIRCSGMLRCQANGREALVSVYPYSEETTQAELRAFNPVSIEPEPMSLEDAFVEFITGAESGAFGRAGSAAR